MMTLATVFKTAGGAIFAGALLSVYICVCYAQEESQTPAVTYIAVAARLAPQIKYPNQKPTNAVALNGVTNLPMNSILNIHIYDFVGQGYTIVDKGDTVAVGQNGEFAVMVLPKPGLEMRANLQVYVSFFPDRFQPVEVLSKVGKRGENLNGPQISGNAGGSYVNAITVVKE
jgi:hypothetical protein